MCSVASDNEVAIEEPAAEEPVVESPAAAAQAPNTGLERELHELSIAPESDLDRDGFVLVGSNLKQTAPFIKGQ